MLGSIDSRMYLWSPCVSKFTLPGPESLFLGLHTFLLPDFTNSSCLMTPPHSYG